MTYLEQLEDNFQKFELKLRDFYDIISNPERMATSLPVRDTCECYAKILILLLGVGRSSAEEEVNPEIAEFLDQKTAFDLIVGEANLENNLPINTTQENANQKNAIVRRSVFEPFGVTKHWFGETASALSHEDNKPLKDSLSSRLDLLTDFAARFKEVSKNAVRYFDNDNLKSLNTKYIEPLYDFISENYFKRTPIAYDLKKSEIRFDLPEVRYIAIAPENIKEDDIEAFFRINWHIVFDLNQNNTSNQLLNSIEKYQPGKLQKIIDAAPFQDSSLKTNWFFPMGSLTKEKLIEPVFRKFFRNKIGGHTNQTFFIIDFCKDKSISQKLLKIFIDSTFEGAYDPFKEGEAAFNKNCCYISVIGADSNNVDKLKEFLVSPNENNQTINPGKYLLLEGDTTKFFKSAEALEILPMPRLNDKDYIGNFQITPEIETRYNASGIYFLKKDERLPLYSKDFLCGYPIQYSELLMEKDIIRKPKEYQMLKEKIKNSFRGNFTISHTPGAGGTTASRRLAFDLMYGNDALECLVVFLKSINNNTAKLLYEASDNIRNKRILIVSEDNDILANEIEVLKNDKNLSNRSRNFIFIRVNHTINREEKGRSDYFLDSRIANEEEKLKFIDKYYNNFLEKSLRVPAIKTYNIENVKNTLQEKSFEDLEVVDFPYSFTEEFIDYPNQPIPLMGSYVTNIYTKFSEPIRKFVEMVAFIYEYSKNEIPASYLKKIWSKEGKNLILTEAMSSEDKKNIKKLLKSDRENEDEEYLWSPKYSSFSKEILNSAYGENYEITKLSELAKEFLNCLPDDNPDNHLKTILDIIFIQQAKRFFKNPDIETKDKNQRFKDKFSYLVGIVYNNFGLTGIKELFEYLIEKYSTESHYYAHFGRFLFEYADLEEKLHNSKEFEEAEENILKGEEINSEFENDDVLLHIHGMLFLRRLQSLKNNLNEARIEDVVTYVTEGEKYFKEANEINTASPHGWMSLAQLYSEAIKIGCAIELKKNNVKDLTSNDFGSICNDEDTIFSSYRSKLDQVVGVLQDFSLEDNEEIYIGYDARRKELAIFYGNLDQTIKYYERKLKSAATDKLKIYIGNSLVQARLFRVWQQKGKNLPWTEVYSDIPSEQFKMIEEDLQNLINMRDLRAYHILFNLYRFNGKYPLEKSLSFLREWKLESQLQEATNSFASVNILWSNFYLGVAIAAILSNKDSADETLIKEMESCFAKTREYDNRLNKYHGKRFGVLGKDRKDFWDTILTIEQAYETEENTGRPNFMKPTRACRQVKSIIKKVAEKQSMENRGFLYPINSLPDVTFYSYNYSEEDVDNAELKGVINFTFRGPGLYNFETNKTNFVKTDGEAYSEIETKETGIQEENNLDGGSKLKILGKINIDEIDRGKKKNKQKEVPNVPLQKTSDKIVNEETVYEGRIYEGEKHRIYPDNKLYFPWKSNGTNKDAYAHDFIIDIAERNLPFRIFESDDYRQEDKKREVYIKTKFKIKLDLENKRAYAIKLDLVPSKEK